MFVKNLAITLPQPCRSIKYRFSDEFSRELEHKAPTIFSKAPLNFSKALLISAKYIVLAGQKVAARLRQGYGKVFG